MSQLANTGTISARVCRVVARHGKPVSQNLKADVSLDKQSDISEKAIKGRALTHGAGYMFHFARYILRSSKC